MIIFKAKFLYTGNVYTGNITSVQIYGKII